MPATYNSRFMSFGSNFAQQQTIARTGALSLLQNRSQSKVNSNITAIHPAPPTVALGIAGAVTVISGGIRVAPKRLTSTIIDTANDPHFEYPGITPGNLSVSSADMTYPPLIIGGSSQAARYRLRYRFQHTGAQLDCYFRMRTTTFSYRIWVDDMPCTAAMQSAVVTIGQRYFLNVLFASSAPRVIELEVIDPEFGGVVTETTAAITRSPLDRASIGIITDSYAGGANGVAVTDVFFRQLERTLGVNYYNLAIGGTGFLAQGGDPNGQYKNRITDMVKANPDVLLVSSCYNDQSFATSDLKTEVLSVMRKFQSLLPTAFIVLSGPWNPLGQNAGTTLVAADGVMRDAAYELGIPYLSMIDPMQIAATTATWIASTAYAVGDYVVASSLVWLCATGHTSGGSFASTNWRFQGFNTGTGNAGAATGYGNGDVLISNDAVHPTLLGHQALGNFFAFHLVRLAKAYLADRSGTFL